MPKSPFNTSAQNLVYHLEVGIGPAILKIFLFVLFMGMISLLFMATQYQGFDDPRAMDQAQLARRFSETGRLKTRVIRPGDIQHLAEAGKLASAPGTAPLADQPDLVNAPLYPVVLGAAFKAFGTSFPPPRGAKYPPEQWVIIPLNLLFSFLSGLFVYLTGRRLFSPRVALTSVTIYLLGAALWKGAVSGTGISLAVLTGSLALWSLVRIMTSRQEGEASGAGLWMSVLIGAAALTGLFLTRYAGIVLLPGYLLALGLSLGRGSRLPIALTLLVFAVGTAPWVLRNLVVSGLPFGLAPVYGIRGEVMEIFMRSLGELDLEGVSLTRGLVVRLMDSARTALTFDDIPMANGLVLCLFVATFFYGFQRDAIRKLRWGFLVSYGCLILAAGLFGKDQFEIARVLAPVVILYGCAFFYLLLDRMQISVQVVSLGIVTLFVAIQSLPLLVTMSPPKPSSYPPYRAGDIHLVTAPFEPNELVCTDMPWATAWYGGQLSLYLPMNVEEFFEIHDTLQPVRGLYFTMLSRDLPYQSELLRGNHRSWKPIMDLNPLPRGWPLMAGFPIRGGESVILADRNRWAGN